MKALLVLMALVLAGCDTPKYGRGEIVCMKLDDQMAMVLDNRFVEQPYMLRLSKTGASTRADEFELKPCDQFSLTP